MKITDGAQSFPINIGNHVNFEPLLNVADGALDEITLPPKHERVGTP